MKNRLWISGLMIAVAVSLSACEQKTSGEQLVNCIEQNSSRKEQDKCLDQIKPSDKERERMDKIDKSKREAYDKVLGRNK